RQHPQLRRGAGGEDRAIRAQPRARGRGLGPGAHRSGGRPERGQGGAPAGAWRQPGALAPGRVLPGARPRREQGQLFVLSERGRLYSGVPVQAVRLNAAVGQLLGTAAPPPAQGTTLIVFPSIALHDGRGANKPWLQELPDPVSKITWHGWVEVHPETAAKWQLANGDVLRLTSPHGALRAPVWITPGVRPDVLAVPTGQGHTAYGRFAKDRSFKEFELLSDAPAAYGGRAFAVSVAVAKTGDHRPLATLEGDAREQGRGVIEVLPLTRAQQLKPGA